MIRIGVAERVDGDASHAVEVLVAVGVVQITPLATLNDKVGAGVGLQHILLIKIDDVGHGTPLFGI